MPEAVVVALGGHALLRPDQRGTAEEQAENLRRSLAAVVELAREDRSVLIVHGNGPQVGRALARGEAAREWAPAPSLAECVAQTHPFAGAVRAALAALPV